MEDKDFGELLKNTRLRKGDEPQAIADLLKIGLKQYSRFEKGTIVPDIEYLIILSDHFNVDFFCHFSKKTKNPGIAALTAKEGVKDDASDLPVRMKNVEGDLKKLLKRLDELQSVKKRTETGTKKIVKTGPNALAEDPDPKGPAVLRYGSSGRKGKRK